ncbi:hypothetical protein FNV43_RR25170 [Rhamnella rubrinervis]|uniref:Uncharacterized protein n=1 Tax=Rhamnella rubrinervis TaxID=2594499 RepID=A0A8K0GLX6_9ROSA|nr:hypothetical protein FNV43_RR25170 [Rhamnella rubrinervis]
MEVREGDQSIYSQTCERKRTSRDRKGSFCDNRSWARHSFFNFNVDIDVVGRLEYEQRFLKFSRDNPLMGLGGFNLDRQPAMDLLSDAYSNDSEDEDDDDDDGHRPKSEKFTPPPSNPNYALETPKASSALTKAKA